MKERPWTTNEKAFVLEAIRSGDDEEGATRLDGRHLNEHRACKINYLEEHGFVEASLGNTKALCQVQCSVVAPSADRPSEGFFRYNANLSATASPSFSDNRQSTTVIELVRLLERAFRESRALDPESLCIQSGTKVWAISVNVTILNDDGNLADVAVLVAMAGLLHFRRPYVSVEGDHVKIHAMDEHEPVSLSIHHRPLAVSIASIDGGQFLLIDPTPLEEAVADGVLTVCMNGHGEICCINSGGGTPLSKSQMLEMLHLVRRKHAVINQELEESLSKSTQPKDTVLQTSGDTEQVKSTEMETAPDTAVPVKPSSIAVEEPGTAALFQGEGSWT
eukprot:m.50508 g.50508  ORF g.50508 m.50508 type:complete len:334 (-) comp13428_c0_seq1:46-1047(-)